MISSNVDRHCICEMGWICLMKNETWKMVPSKGEWSAKIPSTIPPAVKLVTTCICVYEFICMTYIFTYEHERKIYNQDMRRSKYRSKCLCMHINTSIDVK